jgi:DNA-binding XRE family transcriptional regulator
LEIIPGGVPSRGAPDVAAQIDPMPTRKSAANIALGTAARSLRAERGLPQEALAAQAGIDRSYYGAIERGEFNVTLDTIVKIARALNVPAAVLLQRAEL